MALQQFVDEVCSMSSSMPTVNVSLTVSDPSLDDCPFIAISEGFAELTGYCEQELIGRSSRILLERVPEHLIDTEVQLKCNEFMQVDPNLTHWQVGVRRSQEVHVQVNSQKSGELSRNAFMMEKVYLWGRQMIVALHAQCPEDSADPAIVIVEQGLQEAFSKVLDHISGLEFMLEARNVGHMDSESLWHGSPWLERGLSCGVGAIVHGRTRVSDGGRISPRKASGSSSLDSNSWFKFRQTTGLSETSTVAELWTSQRTMEDEDDYEDNEDLD